MSHQQSDVSGSSSNKSSSSSSSLQASSSKSSRKGRERSRQTNAASSGAAGASVQSESPRAQSPPPKGSATEAQDATAMVAALQEQMRQQAELLRAQQQQQQALLQQLAALTMSTRSGSASVVDSSVSANVRAEVRLSAVQPPELTYAGATNGSALDDWLFKLDQLFVQTRTPESAWEERMRTAQLHWDRHMALWWTGHTQAASAANTPVASWSAFVDALRKQFVPTGDAETARGELFRIQMRGGETMDAYMQRAVLIVARAGAHVDGKTAAALALQGVDRSRFPFAVKEVRRMEREAGVAGLTFPQVRAALTAEAAEEPQLGPRGHGSGTSASAGGGSHSVRSGGAQGGGGGAHAASSRQLRIAALEQQLKALREEEHDLETSTRDNSGKFSAAPLSTPSNVRCHKCGADGHVIAECKSKKELRTCFTCKKEGHISRRCPQRRQAQPEGQPHSMGPSGESMPKNE
jgi:hypothetical protein